MSDQAIVALVCGVGGGFLMFFWFLLKMQNNGVRRDFGAVVKEIQSLKKSAEEKFDSLEEKIVAMDKTVALKSMVIDYINKEIDDLKDTCKCLYKSDPRKG